MIESCPTCESPEVLEVTRDADDDESAWWCRRCGTVVVTSFWDETVVTHVPESARPTGLTGVRVEESSP